MFILLGGCSRGQCSPRLARTQSRIVHGKIPSPACGGRGSHEKNARIFFMGTREGGRRPEGGEYKTSIYPAWQLLTNPVFIPLDDHPQAQYLSRLAATHKPSVYPAWRLPTSPAFTPPGARQILNLVRKESLPPLAGDGAPMKKMLAFFSWVPGKVAAGRKGEYKTRIYPAWRLPTNPAFIPLGGCPQTPCLSRLVAAHEPSVYPAWTLPRTQRLSRLADAREPSIYPAWWPPINPVFIPLGSRPQTQCLSRLAAAHESSVYPAWWHSAC